MVFLLKTWPRTPSEAALEASWLLDEDPAVCESPQDYFVKAIELDAKGDIEITVQTYLLQMRQ